MTVPQWEKVPAGWKLSLVGKALGILVVAEGWSKFAVFVQGIPSEALYDDLETAKRAGVVTLRKLMQDANHQLDLLRMQTPLSEHFGRTAK